MLFWVLTDFLVEIFPQLIVLISLIFTYHSARQGRRVGNHPHCRKCGFDLTGKPDESKRCPECGANLRLSRAIQTGRTEPYVGIRNLCVVLMAGAGVLLAFSAYHRVEKIPWIQYRNTSWLIEQIERGSGAEYDKAVAETHRRIAIDKMKPEDEARLLTIALDHQGDLQQDWKPVWGELIEAIHRARRLSPANRDRYFAQAVQYGVRWTWADRSRREFQLTRIADRLPPNTTLSDSVTASVYAKHQFAVSSGQTLAGEVFHPLLEKFHGESHDPSQLPGYEFIGDANRGKSADIGVRIRWDTATGSRKPPPGHWAFKVPIMIVVGSYRCEKLVEVPLPIYEEPVKVTTAVYARRMRESIRIARIHVDVDACRHSSCTTIDFNIVNPPVDLIMEPELSDPKSKVSMQFHPDPIRCAAGKTSNHRIMLFGPWQSTPFDIFPIPIRLVPGESTANAQTIWGEPIDLTVRSDGVEYMTMEGWSPPAGFRW